MRKRKLKLVLLLVLLLGTSGFAWDVSRQPDRQLTARAYVGCVHVYQAVGRPLLKGWVACRFRPTCSDYSIAAVQRHGIIHGLALTFRRLRSCQNSVPMGTVDNVPD
ncbi:MAG TPA: membrane protein insertion efficiency factor YidD [Pyrinomonadaceae bacterium]|nr:membrane protein insertion efficiency factor YidD [Pyrinomonadaceae bacterium]